MQGVDSSLGRGLFLVDHCFFVVVFFVEVDEVHCGSSLFRGAISRIVSYLATFEAGVVGHAGRRLGYTALCRSPLLSPLIRGPKVAEVHWNGLVIEHSGGVGRVDWRHPVSDRIAISTGVGWCPPSHGLLGMLKEGWGWLSSLGPRVSPISSICSPEVALIPKHILYDLAGFGRVDCLLLHFFVSGREGGLHYFGGDGSGEALEEEVGTFVVSCGVTCEPEQFLIRGDIGVDVRPPHVMVVQRSSHPLLF